jgi:hypothetical protein
VQDLKTLSMRMEVVDGQQRLRTLLAFIDPGVLHDYDERIDRFTVRRIHNPAIADRPFSRLDDVTKQHLLAYELSTHVFPATTSDGLVFRIFARLNSTGLSLRPQEIRNAQFHGAFKTLVYDLSFQCLDYWRKWRVFSNEQIYRMDETEAVSEYLMAMVRGIEAKSQSRITNFYKAHDDDLPGIDLLRARFETTAAVIDDHLGIALPSSAFRRPALFYSLYAAIYDHMYGLSSPLENVKPRPLPNRLADGLRDASNRIRTKDLPERVQDAMEKATADKARRDVRHEFIVEALHLEPTR